MLLLALAVQVMAGPDYTGLAVHRDIPYHIIEGVDPALLSLDIYAPVDAQNLPVVMMIHGGGWATGDKQNSKIAGRKPQFFCDNDFVYVSVNYRLSPAVEHPAHIEDVAASFAWIYENVTDYGGDPGQIHVIGHSAGAHLAALLATDPARLPVHDLSNADISSVILLDGAGYDIPQRMAGNAGRRMKSMYRNAFGNDGSKWADASPTLHVSDQKSYPPFLILHTIRADAVGQSMELGDALRSGGSYAFNHAARDKSHRTVNSDLGNADDWLSELVLDFLADGDVDSQP